MYFDNKEKEVTIF